MNQAQKVEGAMQWSYLGVRKRVREIVAHTKASDTTSRVFDAFIVALILLNVVAMVVESVKRIYDFIPGWFFTFECFSVAVFSVEYAARIWSCVEDPQYKRPVLGRIRFALTPLAIVDMLAVLPTAILGAGFLEDLERQKKRARCPHCGKEITG